MCDHKELEPICIVTDKSFLNPDADKIVWRLRCQSCQSVFEKECLLVETLFHMSTLMKLGTHGARPFGEEESLENFH